MLLFKWPPGFDPEPPPLIGAGRLPVELRGKS
jgi:hypothetical protein